jgi:thiol-disulfide isomerase/thioredoxin
MTEFFNNQRVMSLLKFVKPWLSAIAIVLILRYTGALAGISMLANSALMKVGVMDYNPDSPALSEDFNFNFRLKDLDGNLVDFTAYKGKVVVINLWATWCAPCRVEMPSIQSLYSKIESENIEFVILSLDRDSDFNKVKKYIAKNKFTFPVFTPHGYLAEQLQTDVIPTTLVLNKAGKIVNRKTGATNFDTANFRKFLKRLVEE